MTLGELRHIASARAIVRASVVEQDDGQFHVALNIGPESVGLAAARDPKRPRPFRSIDGVTGTLRDLGVYSFSVHLR